jgi:hypothetical protein
MPVPLQLPFLAVRRLEQPLQTGEEPAQRKQPTTTQAIDDR